MGNVFTYKDSSGTVIYGVPIGVEWILSVTTSLGDGVDVIIDREGLKKLYAWAGEQIGRSEAQIDRDMLFVKVKLAFGDYDQEASLTNDQLRRIEVIMDEVEE